MTSQKFVTGHTREVGKSICGKSYFLPAAPQERSRTPCLSHEVSHTSPRATGKKRRQTAPCLSQIVGTFLRCAYVKTIKFLHIKFINNFISVGR